MRARCAEAARYCEERGGDLPKLALQFGVANPRVHTNIVGSANPRRMERNVAQIEEAMDEELLGEVLEILKPIRNVTWPQGRDVEGWEEE